MDKKKTSGGLYKNVTVPVKVLDIFIITGIFILLAVTITALILR